MWLHGSKWNMTPYVNSVYLSNELWVTDQTSSKFKNWHNYRIHIWHPIWYHFIFSTKCYFIVGWLQQRFVQYWNWRNPIKGKKIRFRVFSFTPSNIQIVSLELLFLCPSAHLDLQIKVIKTTVTYITTCPLQSASEALSGEALRLDRWQPEK